MLIHIAKQLLLELLFLMVLMIKKKHYRPPVSPIPAYGYEALAILRVIRALYRSAKFAVISHFESAPKHL